MFGIIYLLLRNSAKNLLESLKMKFTKEQIDFMREDVDSGMAYSKLILQVQERFKKEGRVFEKEFAVFEKSKTSHNSDYNAIKNGV
jgi:hypothetical protein